MEASRRGERTNVNRAVNYVKTHKQGNNVEQIAREMAKYKLEYLNKMD